MGKFMSIIGSSLLLNTQAYKEIQNSFIIRTPLVGPRCPYYEGPYTVYPIYLMMDYICIFKTEFMATQVYNFFENFLHLN